MTATSRIRDSIPTDFPLLPADARLIWLLPGLAMLAVVIGAVVLMQRQPEAWVMLPFTLAIGGMIALILHRRRISIVDGTLVIAAGVNTRRVAIGDLDLATARVVDLRERREWKPTIKLFGTSVPGLKMGHFRLRDRSRAFVLVTDASRVLVISERSGRRLLLSLAKPQALLDALQTRTGTKT
ncbi:PH domain-containing protein [Lysobacter tyrosinilyticus]